MSVHIAHCEGLAIEAFAVGPLCWLNEADPIAPPELMAAPPAPFGTQYGRDWWEAAKGCYLVTGHDRRAVAAAFYLADRRPVERRWVQFWRREAGYEEWAVEWVDQHAPGAVAVTKNKGW